MTKEKEKLNEDHHLQRKVAFCILTDYSNDEDLNVLIKKLESRKADVISVKQERVGSRGISYAVTYTDNSNTWIKSRLY